MNKVITICNSFIGENTFLIGEEECYIIDPGSDSKIIERKVKENFKGAKAILLTHGHIDHVLGVDYLAEAFKCPVYLHPLDLPYIDGEYQKKYSFYGIACTLKAETIDVLRINDPDIIIYETPGHSKGSVCFYFKKDKILFSGDTLFCCSIGRTDLPGGSNKEMMNSLKFLKTLDDDIKVYPGHERITNLGLEKKYNPFLIQA